MMNIEEFELTKRLNGEELKRVDAIEKYLLDNHIDVYCNTKRTTIKEWVLKQNKKDDEEKCPRKERIVGE